MRSFRGTGQLFNENKPIICIQCKCQAFQNRLWNFMTDPPECVSNSESATLTNSEGKGVFFITGGDSNTSETFDGSVWKALQNLPERVSNQCIVKINSSTILSIGGFVVPSALYGSGLNRRICNFTK